MVFSLSLSVSNAFILSKAMESILRSSSDGGEAEGGEDEREEGERSGEERRPGDEKRAE